MTDMADIPVRLHSDLLAVIVLDPFVVVVFESRGGRVQAGGGGDSCRPRQLTRTLAAGPTSRVLPPQALSSCSEALELVTVP